MHYKYITIRAMSVRIAIAKGTAREANAPIYASFSRQFGFQEVGYCEHLPKVKYSKINDIVFL